MDETDGYSSEDDMTTAWCSSDLRETMAKRSSRDLCRARENRSSKSTSLQRLGYSHVGRNHLRSKVNGKYMILKSSNHIEEAVYAREIEMVHHLIKLQQFTLVL